MFLIVFIVLFIVDVPISSTWRLADEFSAGWAATRVRIRVAAHADAVNLELGYSLAVDTRPAVMIDTGIVNRAEADDGAGR